MKTPVGERQATLTLQTAGEALTGTQAAADFGAVDIKSGRVSGNDLSWQVSVMMPMPLTVEFAATIEGDAMSGTADIGWMGSFPFTGTRG
jgi:hypothetical protein